MCYRVWALSEVSSSYLSSVDVLHDKAEPVLGLERVLEGLKNNPFISTDI